jgi:hypothetical protein
MPQRAFPVVYAHDVERWARFYQRLGFQAHFRLPPEGDTGYVGLRRGTHELAVTTIDSPTQLLGVQLVLARALRCSSTSRASMKPLPRSETMTFGCSRRQRTCSGASGWHGSPILMETLSP